MAQPAPKPDGKQVTPLLVDWLLHEMCGTVSAKKIVEMNAQLMERYDFGMKKYGQPLMTGDGRNEVVDAREEALDMLQYTYKAILNGRGREVQAEMAPYIAALCKMLNISVVEKQMTVREKP